MRRVFIIIVVLICLCMNLFRIKEDYHFLHVDLKHLTQEVDAEIVDIEKVHQTSGSSTIYYPVYEADIGGKMVRHTSIICYNSTKDLKKGQKVKMKYNPTKKEMYSKYEIDHYGETASGRKAAIIFELLLAVLFLGILIWQIKICTNRSRHM